MLRGGLLQLRPRAIGGVTRILTITNMYPPHHLGGYELSCRDAVERWRANGHEVSILASDQTFDHAADDGDPTVMRQLKMYWRDGVIVAPPLRERVKIERSNLDVLRRRIDETRPDVVSIWHMGAMSLGLLTEISRHDLPMVLVIEDLWLVYGPVVDGWTGPFRRRAWARGLAERVTSTHTTVELGSNAAVCYMSDWLRRISEERSPLELPARGATVYGGIDHGTFTRGSTRSADGVRRLLCAGRVEERKGVHVAVEALGSLPDDVHLDIVGSWDDEAYVARVRERARELGVDARVHWRGQVARAELADAHRAADVYIFPVIWEEPFGMAPLEAMACGTPVVGTGTGGSAEFLVHEMNCLRTTPGDADAIADAVRRATTDDDLRARLVDGGLATAAYFDDATYAAELEAWHIAAANRFADGTPQPRAPLTETLARIARPR